MTAKKKNYFKNYIKENEEAEMTENSELIKQIEATKAELEKLEERLKESERTYSIGIDIIDCEGVERRINSAGSYLVIANSIDGCFVTEPVEVSSANKITHAEMVKICGEGFEVIDDE